VAAIVAGVLKYSQVILRRASTSFGEAVLAELVLARNSIEWIIDIEVGQMSQHSSRKTYPNP
jgi:hypothetical protein